MKYIKTEYIFYTFLKLEGFLYSNKSFSQQKKKCKKNVILIKKYHRVKTILTC